MVQLSSKKFLIGCAVLAAVILASRIPVSPAFIGGEVLLTIVCLFVFGSTKYQLDKNALTYGAIMVIAASFATGWWPSSVLRSELHAEGATAIFKFMRHHLFTLHGLDELIHADTMLFILGLTFFVCVIAQTRILESVSFAVLRKNKGAVLPTVAFLTALVSVASGVLDGVSMIGLMIRTLVIILFLAKAEDEGVIFAVIISTVITTVCGMWLAYGEPPNLIMKANLDPFLTNGFFIRYCLPVAVGTYGIVFWNLRKRLAKKKINMSMVDEDIADRRFYHVAHYGQLADTAHEEKTQASSESPAFLETKPKRIRAQAIGYISFIPFVSLLIAHGINHEIPLFLASVCGFAVAFIGIAGVPKMRKLAIREAIHEYKEYLFLFPLFLSIALLQKSGFFKEMSVWLHNGIESLGTCVMAFVQFTAACLLSALLDNNVVADFASRALHGLDVTVLHLFSMAQIAGYAAGGCWTHIGSAQSVVAYAFILKEVNPAYTPFQWIRAMTPVILQIFALMVGIIYLESCFLNVLQ